MLFSRQALGLAAALGVALGFNSCLFSVRDEKPEPFSLRYALKVIDGPRPQAEITIGLERWPSGLPRVFIFPPYYADNPAWPLPGMDMSSLRLKDCADRVIPTSELHSQVRVIKPEDSASVPGHGLRLELPEIACGLSYALDLDTLAPGRYGLALPDLRPGLQLLDGSALFALPWTGNGKSLGVSWRTPMEITLDVNPPPGNRLTGLPLRDHLHSPYELMFVRGVLGQPRSIRFQLPLQRGLTDITVFATTSDTINLRPLIDTLPHYLALVENLLGPLPTASLAIGETRGLGGLEGLHGYWFGTPYVGNAELHLHELIHLWLGIRLGDRDFPWFKEGVTTYLGQWLSVQDGWISPEDWRAYMLAIAAESSGPLMQYSLADETARPLYFRPLDAEFRDGPDSGWYSLVYFKGAQAALLMDAWILEKSQGRFGLADLVKRVYAQKRPGFSRADWMDMTQRLTGVDPRPTFNSWIDGVGPLPRSSLEEAFASLQLWRDL